MLTAQEIEKWVEVFAKLGFFRKSETYFCLTGLSYKPSNEDLNVLQQNLIRFRAPRANNHTSINFTTGSEIGHSFQFVVTSGVVPWINCLMEHYRSITNNKPLEQRRVFSLLRYTIFSGSVDALKAVAATYPIPDDIEHNYQSYLASCALASESMEMFLHFYNNFPWFSTILQSNHPARSRTFISEIASLGTGEMLAYAANDHAYLIDVSASNSLVLDSAFHNPNPSCLATLIMMYPDQLTASTSFTSQLQAYVRNSDTRHKIFAVFNQIGTAHMNWVAKLAGLETIAETAIQLDDDINLSKLLKAFPMLYLDKSARLFKAVISLHKISALHLLIRANPKLIDDANRSLPVVPFAAQQSNLQSLWILLQQVPEQLFQKADNGKGALTELSTILNGITQDSLSLLINILVTHIQASAAHCAEALVALKKIGTVYPTYQGLIAQQVQQLVARFTHLLNGANWHTVSTEHLLALKNAGIVEAQSLLVKRDTLTLDTIAEAKRLLAAGGLTSEVASTSCDNLKQLAPESGIPEAYTLIGRLIEAGGLQSSNPLESAYYFYFVGALHGCEEASKAFKQQNTFKNEAMYLTYLVFDGILSGNNITQITLRRDPEQVIELAKKLLSSALLRKKPLSLLSLLVLLAMHSQASPSVASLWDGELQQQFDFAFLEWLKHSENNEILIKILCEYHQKLPEEIVVKALINTIDSCALGPISHAIVVLFATTMKMPSIDLQDVIQFAMPGISNDDREQAEIALLMQNVPIIPKHELDQSIPAKIKAQVVLLGKNNIDHATIMHVLSMLVAQMSSSKGISYEEFLVLQQQFKNSDCKLLYWALNPADLHSAMRSHQYCEILKEELVKMNIWQAPALPTSEPPSVSFDALEPHRFFDDSKKRGNEAVSSATSKRPAMSTSATSSNG